MTHAVTRNCIDCKDMSCTKVCPMECFHIGPKMLYINPEMCIDCGACVVECPVDAIFHEDDVPQEFFEDIGINAAAVLKHPPYDG